MQKVVVPANAGTQTPALILRKAVGHRALSTNHAVWVPPQGRDDYKK
jgi:hypothetical protein